MWKLTVQQRKVLYSKTLIYMNANSLGFRLQSTTTKPFMKDPNEKN